MDCIGANINKWNFPSGRFELGEDILYAACREAKVVTGFDVTLNGTTSVYNFISNTNNQVFLFHFTGQVNGGSLYIKEDEIFDCKWVKVDELVKFDIEELRELGVLKQIINNL
jgi:8-oxo-dGTP diphosphatase